MSAEVFFARMDERCARIEAEMSAFKVSMMALMDQRLAEMRVDFNARFAALYKAMIITAITSTLTIILGVGAINATVFTGMLAAMDTGKDAGSMMARLERRMLDQDAQFNRMLLKQREDFARLHAGLDARQERELAERERANEERRKKDEATERAHQQLMRALRAAKRPY